MRTSQIKRRTILRGLGVSMALPWMESLSVWGAEPQRPASTDQAPTRMAILFSGCGFHSNEWWAKGQGAEMELGKVLQPLHDFRDRMVFINGLYNAEALKGNIHSSQTGNLLSGAPLSSGGSIKSGTSVDQVVAQKVGRQTKLSSLVLGCEKSNPSVHKNYSMLYSSHISWSSPTTPTPLEVYPALAFDQLFKDKTQKGDRSVLDAVLEDANDFRRGISRLDQQKLDEYLNSVREVETRIDRAGQRGELQGWRPTLSAPNIARPQRASTSIKGHAPDAKLYEKKGGKKSKAYWGQAAKRAALRAARDAAVEIERRLAEAKVRSPDALAVRCFCCRCWLS